MNHRTLKWVLSKQINANIRLNLSCADLLSLYYLIMEENEGMIAHKH